MPHEMDIPEGARAAYDGRFLLGWTFARGKEFVALRSDRTLIGTFAKELEARNALWLGRYHHSPSVASSSADPTKIGVPERAKADRPCRIVAGPAISPEQARLATIGVAFDLDRKLNRRHWIEAERAEIETSGHFENTEWLELIGSDGTRCFTAAGADT